MAGPARGAVIVERLEEEGRIVRLPADPEAVNALLQRAQEYLAAARLAADADLPTPAFQLADSAIQSAYSAMLQCFGMRVPEGSEDPEAVDEAAVALFGHMTGPLGKHGTGVMRRARTLRRHPDRSVTESREAYEAIETAQVLLRGATAMVEQMPWAEGEKVS